VACSLCEAHKFVHLSQNINPAKRTFMQAAIFPADESREYFFEEGCFILELANSADDPALSVARARLAPGQRTRLHCLQGLAERYVVLAGTGRVTVGALPPQTVGAGAVVHIPPGCPQSISNTGADDLVFLVLCTPRFTPAAYTDLEGAAAAD
jgi:mannose-6-phosphate isomerase-like protein (cupin superfamily)